MTIKKNHQHPNIQHNNKEGRFGTWRKKSSVAKGIKKSLKKKKKKYLSCLNK